VTPLEFDRLRNWLKAQSGLTLSADKQYLVDSRLAPVMRRHGLRGLADLMRRIDRGEQDLITAVVEAMTTNETYFFRDKLPFEHFRATLVPAIMTARSRHRVLRIWCAASSTGQEPYSLAIMLKEMRLPDGWRVNIVATDLSGEVLDKAKAGVFSQFEVQRGLPIALLVKYFTQSGESWQIKPELRDMIEHRRFNLLHDFAPLGKFDIIFCRNVLLYFARPAKNDVLSRLRGALAPDGYLVLGAAETLVGLNDAFMPTPDLRGVYLPTPHSAASPAAAGRRVLTAD
jgi:chemotaxis protein methyltransferase CheR